jgi:hypothetical protein
MWSSQTNSHTLLAAASKADITRDNEGNAETGFIAPDLRALW